MIALWILAGVAALILLLLVCPVTVRVRAGDGFTVRLSYLVFRFSPGGRKRPRRRAPTGETPGKKSEKKPKRGRFAFLTDLFRENDLPDAISELGGLISTVIQRAGGLLRHSRMTDFRLELRIRGADAASAAIRYGETCAVLYPLLAALEAAVPFRKQEVRVFCDYDAGKTSGDLRFTWRVAPVFAVGQLVALAGELAGRSASRGGSRGRERVIRTGKPNGPTDERRYKK